MHERRQQLEALAFEGDRLVSAGADGVRVWDPASGALVARGEGGEGLLRLAVAPGGRVVASAGLDRTIRLHSVASGALVVALAWHEAGVWGLAWADSMLLSGDAAGRVALWDLGQWIK